MKRRVLLTVVLLACLGCGMITAQNNTWTGVTSTAWNTASNWSLGHAPTAAENAVIPAAPVNQPVINGTISPVCQNLTIQVGASLAITATISNNALLTASGSATIYGSLTISGSIGKTGKLEVQNITWASGSSYTGNLASSIEVSGNWQFSAGSAVSMGLSTVTFTGSATAYIYSFSSSSQFTGVTIDKGAGNYLYIHSTSTASLKFGGIVTLTSGIFIGLPNITTIFSNNIAGSGQYMFQDGTVSLEKSSGTQSVVTNPANYFNNLTVNSGGTVTFSGNTQVRKNLVIQSGVLDPQGFQIEIRGNWTNNVGSAGFTEGTGRVIFSGPSANQVCSDETFNILEINKISFSLQVDGSTVTCAQYDYAVGSVTVLNNGTFTANDLVDNGIYGAFYLNPGCEINLYQDAGQFIDLGATLNFNGGGTFNVYGGSSVSVWGFNAAATLTMNGGTLDFKDQGFSVLTAVPYPVGVSVTGGTIRTTGNININSVSFDPAGGTVEMYGSGDRTLAVTNGWLYHLKTNKTLPYGVTLDVSLSVKGNFTADNGTFTADNRVIILDGDLNVNDNAVFHLGAASQLRMAANRTINVNANGSFETAGTLADGALVTNQTGNYFLNVQNLGTISSKYTTFNNCFEVAVYDGAIIDPSNAFYQCTFKSTAGTSLLYVANSQTLYLHGVNFPTIPPGFNVTKNNNSGWLTFKDATGMYAGAGYENDPFGRVDWSAGIAGRWTGIISSDWYDPGNWDDYAVPGATTDVLILSAVPNDPVIGSGDAYCNDIQVVPGAFLTVGNGDLNVGGDMTIHGQLTENHANADINVADDIFWELNSVADITAGEIRVSGDWMFRDGSTAQIAGGTVIFTGSGLSYIRSHERNSWFNNLTVNKSGGTLYNSNVSTDTLRINGTLFTADATSVLSCNSSYPTVLKGQFNNSGHLWCPAGTFIFNGTTHTIDLNTGDYFNNLVIRSSGTVTLADSLRIRGNLGIETGTLSAVIYTVMIQGDWSNLPGSAGFYPGAGKVVFEGDGPSDINTYTAFNNLTLNKTYTGPDGLELNDSIYIMKNLDILDGTFEMNSGSRLYIIEKLTIAAGSGLNANDPDVRIYIGDDWIDENLTYSTTVGFNAGTGSTVHFLNKEVIQTVRENNPFNDVVVDGNATYTRPDVHNLTCRNLSVIDGAFRLYGYKVTVNQDVSVRWASLRVDMAGDSLVIGDDMVWDIGSTGAVTAGKILVGGDWTFKYGTNIVLGTGNTVIFNQNEDSDISNYDPEAAFGNLEISKSDPTARTSLFITSTDTTRIAGTLTIKAANELIVTTWQELVVQGAVTIQPTGTLRLEGYFRNNHPTFILGGDMVMVPVSTALVRGMFELGTTGELSMSGGTFTCDPPTTGDWLAIRGQFIQSDGIFSVPGNGITIVSTATTNITGGTIITGHGFQAATAGTFQPSAGVVRFNNTGPVPTSILCTNGNYFQDVEIHGECVQGSDLTIKDDLLITGAGVLETGSYDIFIGGDWTNEVGPGGFLEHENTVFFTGAIDADITEGETFYNLVVAKEGTSSQSLSFPDSDTVTVTNDLHIQDGCLKLQAVVRLFVNDDLVIADGAGLNAVHQTFNNYIQVGGDWTNGNVTSVGNNVGFMPGSFCVVTFTGNTDSYLSTLGAREQFAHLYINKPGASFRSNDNIWTRNLTIQSGVWEDNVPGLHHQVTQGFDVLAAGSMQNIVAHNTVEFFGGPGSFSYLSNTGCMYNVIFNAQASSYYILESDLNCLFGGSLTVQSGRLYANGHRIWVEGDLAINDGGWLKMLTGSELVMTDGNSLNVNSGGQLELLGTTLRADPPAARYALNINSGGTLDAGSSVIKNTGINGVYLKPGSILLDDIYHPGFDGCTFMEGASGGTLLRVDNDQTLTVRNAIFPANTWGGTSNVRKTVSSGQVYFVDFSGGFSGESFDDDTFGRITWVPTLTVSASANPESICAGSATQLSSIVSGGIAPYTYFWSPQTGLSDPFSPNPVASPTVTTMYQLTVYDALETEVLAPVTVTILPGLPVSVSITASANPSPPGSFVLFTATPVNGGTSPSYQWKVNGLNAGTGLSTYSYVPSNGDVVTCVLTSNYMCPIGNPATSNMITMIIVNTNTTVTGNVPSPLSLCFDASNTITVAGGGTTFTVESGGSATMIAGQRIIYLPTTIVQSGGYMHGYITPTHSYCGSLPPAMVAVISGDAELPAPIKSARFSLYPNPTSGIFTLAQQNVADPGTIEVEILTIKGEKVFKTTMRDVFKGTFDLRGQPSGMYIVRIRKADHTEVMKLIINR